LDVGQGLKLIVTNAGLALLTLISVLLIPAAQGAARAVISGELASSTGLSHAEVQGGHFKEVSPASATCRLKQ
jgi:hypothetical protein